MIVSCVDEHNGFMFWQVLCMSAHVYAMQYACICLHTHACICGYVNKCIQSCMNTYIAYCDCVSCLQLNFLECVFVSGKVCVCVCVCVWTDAYSHVCVYTGTYVEGFCLMVSCDLFFFSF
jgi:hypothetical protein